MVEVVRLWFTIQEGHSNVSIMTYLLQMTVFFHHVLSHKITKMERREKQQQKTAHTRYIASLRKL